MITHAKKSECEKLSLQICQMLDGLMLGDAMRILADASTFLTEGHKVDTSCHHFNVLKSEVELNRAAKF
jgi:hypothetical protein